MKVIEANSSKGWRTPMWFIRVSDRCVCSFDVWVDLVLDCFRSFSLCPQGVTKNGVCECWPPNTSRYELLLANLPTFTFQDWSRMASGCSQTVPIATLDRFEAAGNNSGVVLGIFLIDLGSPPQFLWNLKFPNENELHLYRMLGKATRNPANRG